MVCPLIALSLLLPFAIRQNAWFEWTNSLWLVERQEASLRELGHPSYFLHASESGTFYPIFMFYGGALYAAAAALALVIGSAWWSFVGVLVLATACGYLSVLWIGRQLGVSWGAGSLAALVVSTSPYSVTNLYGRGAWNEIVATSAVPLALAGALALMRGARPWRGFAALVLASAVVAGSHNVTIVWGSLFCCGVILAGLIAVGRSGSQHLRGSRVALGLGALALGVAIVAWSFLPAAVYGQETRAYGGADSLLFVFADLDRLDVILRPYPFVPDSVAATIPALHAQLPVFVLVWAALASAFVFLRQRGRATDRRMGIGLWLIFGAITVLLVATSLWPHLPGILKVAQFPFRLHAYAVVVAVLLVLVMLRILQDAPGRRGWLAGLAVALAAQTGMAQYAAWSAPDGIGREEITAAVTPVAFWSHQQGATYRSTAGRPLPTPAQEVAFDPAHIRNDVAQTHVPAAPGATFATNVALSPVIRAVAPWRIVGRDDRGLAIVSAAGGGVGDGPLTIRPSTPWPVRLGGMLSLAALALAMIGSVLLFGRALLARRRAPSRSNTA